MYRPKYTILSNRIALFFDMTKRAVSSSVVAEQQRKIKESWGELTDEEKEGFVFDELDGVDWKKVLEIK